MGDEYPNPQELLRRYRVIEEIMVEQPRNADVQGALARLRCDMAKALNVIVRSRRRILSERTVRRRD